MSVLTEVLKLFKYDPATDGDMTFNIGQCMNDNWDKLDAAILLAIAAAGAYNPEESYAVGDYCTYKGKLHKCSTAIPTGETWTEAHWTTTTVATELAELSSQLSNTIRKYVEIQSGTDLNAVVESGIYRLNGNSSGFTNGPPSNDHGWGIMFVGGYSDDTAFQMLHILGGDIWKRMLQSGVLWSEWIKLSDATPPQEFDLPLAESYDGHGEYLKTQENIVIVDVNIGTIGGAEISNNNMTFATLPAGFRPSRVVYSDAATLNSTASNVVGVAQFWVDANGSLNLRVPSGSYRLRGELVFRAAD